MSDDAKEWVTVKVPKADKEQADEYRPEDSTFGDCLVAGAERLDEHLDSDTERFGEVREDTARDVVEGLREAFGIEGDADLAELLRDEASAGVSDDVRDSVMTIEERTNRIQKQLEDLTRP